MKITIKEVGKGWKPSDAPDTFKPIYTLSTLEHGEPIKTMDPALTTPGTYEAEEYASTSGKKYWRSVGTQSAPQTHTAPPGRTETPDATRSSIEKQSSYKVAAEIVRDAHTFDMDVMDYALEVEAITNFVLKSLPKLGER